ncbi:putative ubiquinol--cytochrome-c reductase [Durotheca rogersii]|uniref:putative ubiquinol--cytochrome-c reductase n=1 Tax=Durotheca rogersii TaxID=419775 RepID=UPI00221FCCE9|nr:putative ubiquinol--cytochrome-c reductase [Durotheca rogersii]KAI5858202.1 putative ubiquinol--cytochrome-c reductase [Durotheca rogersii]
MPLGYPTLAPFVVKRPWLLRLLRPVADWYVNTAGYRQLGLRADDLINEENELVIKALKRLPPKESYDRIYRIRRAFQASVVHKLLPKNEWTKPDEDVPYLKPLIDQILAEEKEKQALDSLTVVKSH